MADHFCALVLFECASACNIDHVSVCNKMHNKKTN